MIRKFCTLLALTVACLCTAIAPPLALATTVQDNQIPDAPRFEKIYVDAESVILAPEGIFFLDQEGLVCPARLVAVDAHGIYVIAAQKYYQCPVCGKWSNTGKCIYLPCPMYGK